MFDRYLPTEGLTELMYSLLGMIAVIGLLDSTSLVPICIIPLAAILGGSRPIIVAASFLSGIFLVYVSSGFLFLAGFEALFSSLGPMIAHWWNHPSLPDLLLQLVLGAIMLAFGWKLARARRPKNQARQEVDMKLSPWNAFVLGASLTVMGMPGAFPYFGAIDLILRAELGFAASGFALVFYNLVFILPLATLLLVRMILPARSKAIFHFIASVFDCWGRRFGEVMLLLLGAILVADAIGWFIGYPLLPVA